MGKYGSEKQKKSNKKLIIIIASAVVVVIAVLLCLYFFLGGDSLTINEKRIIGDIQKEETLTKQKLQGNVFEFEVDSVTYDKNKATSGEDNIALDVKANLKNETYEVGEFPVVLNYTKNSGKEDEYTLKSCDYDMGEITYSAVAGFPEEYAKKVVDNKYKGAELDDHKTDLNKGTDVFTYELKTDEVVGKIVLTYKFDKAKGWVKKDLDTNGLDIKNGKTTTVDVDGVKCYTNPAVKNIILLGTDADEGARRSDSMILVSIDNNNKEIKFSSFMRDTYVDIDGYGKDKLNAAFAYGGPELATKTIEKNYGVKIDNYITTGFSNFKSIVDTLGGVDIELDTDECGYINWQLAKNGQTAKYGEVEVKDGVQKLNGQQALWFCRDRGSEEFYGNDFTRTSRQRRMLMGLIDSYKDTSVEEIQKITNDLSKYIETDLSESDLKWLVKYSYKFFTYKTSDKCYPEETSGWSAGTADNGGWIISMNDWNATRDDIAKYIYTDLK